MDFSCIIGGESTGGVCDIEAMKVYSKTSTIAQVIVQLVIVAVVAGIFYKYLVPFFKQIKEKKTWKWFGICLAIMLVLDFAYIIILNAFNLNDSSANQEGATSLIGSLPVIGFFLAVIAAPLFEEIIFRFGIYRIFINKGKKLEIVGIVVTTILFILLNMQATLMMTFGDIAHPDWEYLLNDLITLPSYLFLATMITLSYYKTKNFLTPMLIHMAWNLIQYVFIIVTVL
jgi:membrane protease YdiL (CAAX protease family)